MRACCMPEKSMAVRESMAYPASSMASARSAAVSTFGCAAHPTTPAAHNTKLNTRISSSSQLLFRQPQGFRPLLVQEQEQSRRDYVHPQINAEHEGITAHPVEHVAREGHARYL